MKVYCILLWNERMTESNTQIETLSCIETTKRRTHKGTHNPITGFQSSTRLTWTNTTIGLNCPQDSGHLYNTPRYGRLREGIKENGYVGHTTDTLNILGLSWLEFVTTNRNRTTKNALKYKKRNIITKEQKKKWVMKLRIVHPLPGTNRSGVIERRPLRVMMFVFFGTTCADLLDKRVSQFKLSCGVRKGFNWLTWAGKRRQIRLFLDAGSSSTRYVSGPILFTTWYGPMYDGRSFFVSFGLRIVLATNTKSPGAYCRGSFRFRSTRAFTFCCLLFKRSWISVRKSATLSKKSWWRSTSVAGQGNKRSWGNSARRP